MSHVRNRCSLLVAALALVIGCALALGTPQTAHAADLKLGTSVGSTAARATILPLVGKSLKSTSYATFNRTNDNHFYKFSTSNRDSRYRIRLRAENVVDGDINITIYDSNMHRFYTGNVQTTNWGVVLRKLTRNSTYYIEIWRYAVDSPQYIDLYKGNNIQYADYRLYVKELITKPKAVTKLKVSSPSKKRLKVKWLRSFNADAYQILVMSPLNVKKATGKPIKFYFYTKNDVFKLKTKYAGEYRVWVRPYRTVNGKKYYGNWRPTLTFKTNGDIKLSSGAYVNVKAA